jgi:hypothetical protein
MRLPSILISQTQAQFSIRQEQGKLDINYPPTGLKLNIQHPELNVKAAGTGQVEIDQTKAWEAFGVKTNTRFTSSISKAAYGLSLKAIARMAKDGDRMQAVHASPNAIAQISRASFGRNHAININGPARYDNVEINYRREDMSVDLTRGNIGLRADPLQPMIQHRVGRVDTSATYPSITFDVIGNNVNRGL